MSNRRIIRSWQSKYPGLVVLDARKKAGQLEEAFRALKEFADLCPDQDDIRLMLADQLTKRERKAEAIDQLQTLTSHSSSALGIGLLVSVALALWSARSGTASLIAALNITYEEPEKRNFIWFQVIALALTAGIVLFMLVALALIAVLPAVIDLLPLGESGKLVSSIVRRLHGADPISGRTSGR